MSGPDPVRQAEDPVDALGHKLEPLVADVGDDRVRRMAGFLRSGSNQAILLNVKDVSVGNPGKINGQLSKRQLQKRQLNKHQPAGQCYKTSLSVV